MVSDLADTSRDRSQTHRDNLTVLQAQSLRFQSSSHGVKFGRHLWGQVVLPVAHLTWKSQVNIHFITLFNGETEREKERENWCDVYVQVQLSRNRYR